MDLIKNLPEETGLYYFYNDNNELIYIGKSKNIKSRVISHINNSNSKRAAQMRQLIADIDYELTGSELVALLKEYNEIRNKKPLYNRKRTGKSIHCLTDSNDNTIVIDRGRSIDEYSIIKIRNGKYTGYGYIDRDIQISHPDIVDDFIYVYDDNRDVQNIIRKYLDNNRVIRIIKF